MSVAIISCDESEENILRSYALKIDSDTVVFHAQNINPETIKNHTHVLMIAHNKSREILSVLGAQLGVQPLTNITEILDDNTFIRPVYAGNAVVTIVSNDTIKLLSLNIHRRQKISSSRDLKNARIVIGGGRALGSKENFQILYNLAEKMGAAVGATRAAVDAGYTGNESQIGQSGVSIAPDLYMAFGISGALQHTGGIRNAKTVIAVNTDPHAPIFRHATYGIVADLFDVLPELIKKLNA